MTIKIYLIFTNCNDDELHFVDATLSLENLGKSFLKESLFNWGLDNIGAKNPVSLVVDCKRIPYLDFRSRYYHTYVEIVKDEN